jgi:hypothetical protein
MNNGRLISALFFCGCLLLSSCQTTSVDFVASSSPEEAGGGGASSRPLHIGVYCAFNIGVSCRESAGEIWRTLEQMGALPSRLFSGEADPAGGAVDIVLRVSYFEGMIGVTDTAEAVSAYSGRTLFRISASGDGDSAKRNMNIAVGRILRKNFVPGAGLYRSLSKERSFYLAQKGEGAGDAGPLSVKGALPVVPKSVEKASGRRGDQEGLSVLSSADLPEYRFPVRRDAYAVVVGIEHYLTRVPDATYARRDALAVRRHLLAMGFAERHIHMIVDREATQGALKSELRWLRNNTDKNSLVFFYFSGHGAPDPASRESYLVTSDARLDDLADSAFPLPTLYRALDRLSAGQVIVALDSCFSGAGGRSVLETGSRPLVAVRTGSSVLGRSVALSAASQDQISGILRRKEHGVFTYYLLEGFNKKLSRAPSRGVSLAALYAYLRPRVEDSSRRHNRTQVPQMLFQSSDPSRIYLK